MRLSSPLVREIVGVRELPTRRRPLLVRGTDQDPVSSNTRYLRPRRNTARLPARTPTKHLPGRLHTAHLPAGNMCRLLPARVEWFTTAQAHASGSRLLSTSQSCRSCSDVNCVLWSLRREVRRVISLLSRGEPPSPNYAPRTCRPESGTGPQPYRIYFTQARLGPP